VVVALPELSGQGTLATVAPRMCAASKISVASMSSDETAFGSSGRDASFGFPLPARWLLIFSTSSPIISPANAATGPADADLRRITEILRQADTEIDLDVYEYAPHAWLGFEPLPRCI
jgi:hypothetical protein